MHSVIDLTTVRRPRRMPAVPPPPAHGVIDLTTARPAVLRPSDVVDGGLTRARLGGHTFTGSLAADILARRPLPKPAPAPTPTPKLKPKPFPKKALGGFLAPRGKPRKLTKNQLHGRGSGYVYRRRGKRKRYFDSAGSYSTGKGSGAKKAKGKGARKKGGAKKGKGRGKGKGTDELARELLRVASALRRSSEARLRRISSSARRAARI